MPRQKRSKCKLTESVKSFKSAQTELLESAPLALMAPMNQHKYFEIKLLNVGEQLNLR